MRHVSAGPRALAAVAELLGLKGAGADWALEGLCAAQEDGPHVRVSLKNGAHRLVFHVLPASSSWAQVRAPGFSLAEEDGAGPAARKFLAVTAARLSGRSVDDVVRILEDDAESFVEHLPVGQNGDRIRVPCIGQPIGLLEAGWRNFYADQDFEVLLGVPDCSYEKTVNVEYADLECFYARPKRSFNKWTFLDWPEESEDGPRDGGDAEGESNIVAELEERDMIMGTGERADALVAEVRKRAAAGDYILFTHLCTPIVMGEDLQGLAKRCEDEVGGSAVRWSQKDRDGNDNFGEHLRALLARPGFFDAPAEPGAVNLFHFPKSCREKELIPFLESIGLRTNLSVFPDIRLPDLERLPKGAAQVFCERTSYPTKFRELLAPFPRPVVTVPAPYGLAGTRACLAGIAAAAGRTREFEAAWAPKEAALRPAWDAMKKEASVHRLAFVVSEATLPRLTSLRYGYGAPPATMAAEMGFGIDIVYYDRHGEAPVLPAELRGARVAAFRSPWELERALRDGEFSAVFSDVFFDTRISRAGKARFSSKDFEMGADGALRTFERLLTVSRLPFYRRYAAHLDAGRRRTNVV